LIKIQQTKWGPRRGLLLARSIKTGHRVVEKETGPRKDCNPLLFSQFFPRSKGRKIVRKETSEEGTVLQTSYNNILET
jgi:hypothetical protein